MAKREGFEVTWEAEDGYCGGSRPHHFIISSSDLDEDMTDNDLIALFQDSMQSEFEQRVYPVSEDEQRFIEWAKEQIGQMAIDK